MLVNDALAQRTRVVLRDGQRFDGELLYYRNGEGLALRSGVDTLHIDWTSYHKHRTLIRDAGLPWRQPIRSRDSLLQRYPLAGKSPFRAQSRLYRYYIGLSFHIKDGMQPTGSGGYPSLLAEVGFRVKDQLVISAVTGFENTWRVDRFPLLMVGGRYRIRDRLVSPYVSYHLGMGAARRNWISFELRPRGGFQQALTLGLEYGRKLRFRPYFELSYRTYRFDLSPELNRFNRTTTEHQQFLSYGFGIRF